MVEARTSDSPSDSARQSGELVEFQEFVSLMISRKRIIRLNEPELGLLGLLEVRTGRRFFIDEESYDRFLKTQRKSS